MSPVWVVCSMCHGHHQELYHAWGRRSIMRVHIFIRHINYKMGLLEICYISITSQWWSFYRHRTSTNNPTDGTIELGRRWLKEVD
ncbi:hypothetical protein Hdeb2414_s0009g00314741 [Helianthus debilis subsp. tardiflorus]